MAVLYVPRAFGGTLVLNSDIRPVTLPTLRVAATFRNGEMVATYKDGEVKATYRNGKVTTGGR